MTRVVGQAGAAETATLRAPAASTPARPLWWQQLGRATRWERSGEVPLGFDAHHPQGLARAHELWWLSTVAAAAGRGWLIGFDDAGREHVRLRLGDERHFHPGGVSVLRAGDNTSGFRCRPMTRPARPSCIG